MAIEPLGSMMSMQAQTVQGKPVAVQPAKQTAEYTEGTVQEAAKVDQSVSVVTNVEQKGNPDSKAGGQQAPGQQVSNEQLRKAVEQINKNISNTSAVFGIHEETNRVTIKIVDKDTKEVIKELPPEKTLDMITKVWELAGILVDEKR